MDNSQKGKSVKRKKRKRSEREVTRKIFTILGPALPNDLRSLRRGGLLNPNVTPPIRKMAAARWFLTQLTKSIENEPAALMFLDAFLTELRAATFTLQKLFNYDSDFKQWYESQRHEMKKDEKLNWLIDARNIAEKEGIVFATWDIHIVRRHYLDGSVEFSAVPPNLKIDGIDREVTLVDLEYMLLKLSRIVDKAHHLFYKTCLPRGSTVNYEILREQADGSWGHS